ncbi:hypothetical protein DYB30_013491 [Aphanomyces astaci]|uniref:Fe2OG dioxygenase domain-containing protein n=1 Tax=Aphanomyces astaci TaxID=112090 RepID=A0A397CZJ1_APHAT|nr:hypothetical protein DYB30_013491 [Aphanomyces astaci]
MPPVNVLLECQAPYTSWILSGRKTIETRRYAFPTHLLHKPIWLLESPNGVVGSSALPSVVDLAATPHVRVVGHITVSTSFQYTSRAQWDADVDRHCVAPDSGYAWTQGGGDYFGWTVASTTEFSQAPRNLTHISRSYRSFFVPVIPVPTVDISDPLNPDVLAAIETQCASLGFLRVSWASFPKDVILNAHDAMRRFFDCDPTIKEAVTLPPSSSHADGAAPRPYKPTGYRGIPKMYNGEGRETWSCIRPDNKDLSDDPFYTDFGRHVFATPPMPQVLWPDEEDVPGFRAALTAYYAAMDALGKVLFRIFARILQLPDEEALLNLARRHASSMNASRLHPSEDTQGGGMVLMPHADITCFTILSHDAQGGVGTACLEVLHPLATLGTKEIEVEEQVVWVGIAPDSNEDGRSLLVNVGQILQRWSNDRLKATLHRVVKPVHASTLTTRRRQAIVFFQVTDYDAILKPMVDTCDASDRKWTPERMDAFTKARFGPVADTSMDTTEAYAIYNQDVMARADFVRLASE